MIVPYTRPDYVYCAVFPTTWSQQWPLALAFDHAVALEFAPAWTDRPRVAFEPTTRQRWPQDVPRYLSTLGYEPRLGYGGVPVVQRDALHERAGLIVDYVTLALLQDVSPQVPVSEWCELRASLQQSLLPETLTLPAGCAAVLHVAAHQLAVLLAPARGLMVSWLSTVLGSSVCGASSSERVNRGLAQWVLRSADKRGLRIDSVTVQEGAGQAGHLVVVGRWGRGTMPSLQAGTVGGSKFEVILPL